MTQGIEGRTTGSADDPDEDTLELELTPEQMLRLSQAAKRVQRTVPPVESTHGSPSHASPFPEPRLQVVSAKRFRLLPLTLAAAVAGITGGITWWAAAQHTAEGDPPAPTVTCPSPAPAPALTSLAAILPPPAAPAKPQGPPVEVRNPFDATEVFVFPTGTSDTDARGAMAELLLQRARDRRSQGVGIEHADSRHPSRGAADKNPVTAATR